MEDALKVLAVGNARHIEELWKDLEQSDILFDMPFAILEDNKEYSGFLNERCMVIPLEEILKLDMKQFKIIFVCSQFKERLGKMLLTLGADPDSVHGDTMP